MRCVARATPSRCRNRSSCTVRRAKGFRIEREDDGSYRVIGRQAERAVALSDLTNLDALDLAHHRLRKLGVDRALARAGVQEGDTVHIGGLSFDYEIE